MVVYSPTTPGGGGGVHLTRFWSRTCHRGFKNISVPYTNFLKKYTRIVLIENENILRDDKEISQYFNEYLLI